MVIITYIYIVSKNNNVIDDTSKKVIKNNNQNNDYFKLQQLEQKFADLISQTITKKPNLYTYYNQHWQQLKQQLQKLNPQDSLTNQNLLNQYQSIVHNCESQLKIELTVINPNFNLIIKN